MTLLWRGPSGMGCPSVSGYLTHSGTSLGGSADPRGTASRWSGMQVTPGDRQPPVRAQYSNGREQLHGGPAHRYTEGPAGHAESGRWPESNRCLSVENGAVNGLPSGIRGRSGLRRIIYGCCGVVDTVGTVPLHRRWYRVGATADFSTVRQLLRGSWRVHGRATTGMPSWPPGPILDCVGRSARILSCRRRSRAPSPKRVRAGDLKSAAGLMPTAMWTARRSSTPSKDRNARPDLPSQCEDLPVIALGRPGPSRPGCCWLAIRTRRCRRHKRIQPIRRSRAGQLLVCSHSPYP